MPQDSANQDIWVVAAMPSRLVDGEKSLFGANSVQSLLYEPMKLNVETLGENLRRFVESMNAMMSRLPAFAEPFRLEEIELSVELNAEGNFQLIGGAKAGVTGGLTLTLKRKP